MKKSLVLPLCTILPACVCGCGATQGKVEKPNFIVILTDDMGYADVGFNGCKDIHTPNIDRIAQEGIRFTNAYVTYSVSSPSRAGIMTGRYGQRFGYERNPLYDTNDLNAGLPLDEMTIAESLSQVGYTSCAVGKWHLGAHKSNHPLNRGFQEFYGFLGGAHDYMPEHWKYGSYEAADTDQSHFTYIMHNHEDVDVKGYLTDAFSDAAVDFVKRNKDNPFFLYLAYNAPHTPQQATSEYLDRYKDIKDPKRKKYAAMMSAVDDGVGKLLDYLDESGLSENTIVWFLSDNGGPEKSNGSDNGPLREGKSSWYEGGFRVPAAIRWKGHLPENEVYGKTVSSLDIFATAVGLSGSSVQEDKPLDGVNLLPYLLGEDTSNPHPVIYLRKWDQGVYAVRNGDYKLVTFEYGEGKAELYNVAEDISEKHDIAAEHPEVVQELQEIRKEWSKGLLEPKFLGLRSLKK